MKRRALILSIDFPPMAGGMARWSRDVADALSRAGCAVTVVAPDTRGKDADTGISGGITIRRIRGLFPPRHFDCLRLSAVLFFLYGFRQSLPGRPDIIIANTWSIAGTAAYALGAFFKVPYCVCAHGLDVCAAASAARDSRLMRRVFEKAAAVIAISHFTAGLVKRAAAGAYVAVIHPVVEPGRFTARGEYNPAVIAGKRIILSVGRLVDSKNHATIIRALPAVIAGHPDVVYRIVGDGPRKEDLAALAAGLGLSEKVIFEGYVPDEDMPLYYQACDVFALVSRAIPVSGEVEGFGIVFLEAAACAKPVVASKSGGIPDAVRDGVTGILVEPHDEKAVSDALLRILSDADLAARLGENGRTRVEESFTAESLGRRLGEILDNA